MKAERAVVHIGFEKAGSTSLQRFLGMNYAALKRAGWLYPMAAGRPAQVNLPCVVMDDGRIERMRARLGLTSEEAIAGFRSRFHAELAAEIEASRPRALIFSHENLSTRLTSAEIARLHGLLAEFAERVTILAYVRRQDELPMSLYSTAVLGGRGEPFVYPADETEAPAWFDYHAVLAVWAEVFGAENLKVRRFGQSYFEGGDLLGDFLEAAGLEATPLARTEHLNSGFDLTRLEFVRLMNVATGGRSDARRHALARRLHDESAGRRLGASRRRRRAFAARFEQSNRRVAKEFLGLDGALFDHPYPNDPPGREPALTAAEAVRLALALMD